MKDINFSHLRTFAKVVELGSFSEAAETLELTQPAISIQIKALEEFLGVRVVERSRQPQGKVTPTLAGKELLKHVNRIDLVISKLYAGLAPFKTMPHQ